MCCGTDIRPLKELWDYHLERILISKTNLQIQEYRSPQG